MEKSQRVVTILDCIRRNIRNGFYSFYSTSNRLLNPFISISALSGIKSRWTQFGSSSLNVAHKYLIVP